MFRLVYGLRELQRGMYGIRLGRVSQSEEYDSLARAMMTDRYSRIMSDDMAREASGNVSVLSSFLASRRLCLSEAGLSLIVVLASHHAGRREGAGVRKTPLFSPRV